MTATTRSSPVGALLSRLVVIEPKEIPAVVASFFLFFFMWAGYFAVRPVRETVGTLLGRQAVADLWLYTAIFSILIIPIFGIVVARFRRSTFLPWTYGIVAGAMLLVGLTLNTDDFSPLLGKVFYVFISVINLFLISMFWSFLLELFDRGQSKRLFGAIAAGGSLGAFLAPLLISDVTVKFIGLNGVLYVSAALFVAAIVSQRVLLRLWSARPLATSAAEDKPIGGNLFAGVPLVLRSPYLLGIALFIVGVSAANTILYFEQLRVVTELYPNPADAPLRTQVFARFDWLVQGLTVLTQIFLTGQIAKRFGVTALLAILPAAMVLGFLTVAGSTSFALFASLVIFRRVGEYAFVRPGREMLWSPLDKETKYKAKNTVDVPIYRAADYLGAQANVALGALGVTAAGMMVVGAVLAALWGAVGWWLGRRFEANARERSHVARPVAQESKA
jgi:AAA family ATP:ADP antiporter